MSDTMVFLSCASGNGATGPTGPTGPADTRVAAAVADSTGATDAAAQLNALLASLRAAGLLAT